MLQIMGNNTVSIINGTAPPRVIATISVGSSPTAIAVDPETHYVYVANGADDTISIIDGTYQRSINTISVGSSPTAIAV